jgi:serine/threonine-protein kinase RsbW
LAGLPLIPSNRDATTFLDTVLPSQANCPCAAEIYCTGQSGADNHGINLFSSKKELALADSTVNRMTITLESNLDSVEQAEAMAEEVAARAGISEDERFQIAMAVREGTVNAIMHGNAYDPTKKVTVSFENDGSSLIIRISDQGAGLDYEHLPDPLAPENILRGSGRGIFLIRSFMDDVKFRRLSPGTELTLVKHLPTAQPGA